MVDLKEEEKVVQEEEQVESNVVELDKKEENVEVTPQVEEEPGVEADLRISYETFYEFYNAGGVWPQIRQGLILCALMCLIIYLFRNKETATASYLLQQMGIFCGIIIVVTAVMAIITAKVTLPRQYKKFGLENKVIHTKFTNLGITQWIPFEGQEPREIKVPWNQIAFGKETEKSLMFYGMRRSGFIFTKDGLTEEDLIYIRGVIAAAGVNLKQGKAKKK